MAESHRLLRLVLRTPAAVEVDEAVCGVTAEDGSGRFGLRPGAEPIVAALVPSLFTYRDRDDNEHLVAVGPGSLRGDREAVEVAVRYAVICSTPDRVREEVLAASRLQREGERAMHQTLHALRRRLLKAMVEEERVR